MGSKILDRISLILVRRVLRSLRAYLLMSAQFTVTKTRPKMARIERMKSQRIQAIDLTDDSNAQGWLILDDEEDEVVDRQAIRDLVQNEPLPPLEEESKVQEIQDNLMPPPPEGSFETYEELCAFYIQWTTTYGYGLAIASGTPRYKVLRCERGSHKTRNY